MFMHSSVKRFTIDLPESTRTESLRLLFRDIYSRMPGLTHLDIQTTVPMNVLEDETIRLFESLPNLQDLITPRFFFTTRIANCLSKLPQLGCMETHGAEYGAGDPDDVAVFRPELAEGAFPSLWDLSLASTYPDAERFLTIPFAPSNITMFSVESPFFEAPSSIHQLLTIVSETCQPLRHLTIMSPRQNSSNRTSDPDGTPARVTIDTLQPVLSCSNLKHFEIIHQYSLDLRQQDLEVLALHWPLLEGLILNPQPHNFKAPPDLTLEALFPFSQHCIHLTLISLFVNASVDAISLTSPTSPPLPTFKHLVYLAMGLSAIQKTAPVAVFLSHILPLGCMVDSGVVLKDSFETDDHGRRIISKRHKMWSGVDDVLPILTRVRIEERERMKAMMKEMEDLRTRMKDLMDK